MSDRDTIVGQKRAIIKPCADCKHCSIFNIPLPYMSRKVYTCSNPKIIHIDKVTGKSFSPGCEDQRDPDSESPRYCGQEGFYFERKESI